jgi:hypothetical protein
MISLGVVGLFALTGVIAATFTLSKSNNPPAIRIATQAQDELPLAARAPSPALPQRHPVAFMDSSPGAATENTLPTHDLADSGAMPVAPPRDEVSTVTAEPASSTPALSLDDLLGSASASGVTGAVVTTNGWLMQVEGASDGTYTLELADAPRTGAPSIVVALPPPDGLPSAQHQANEAAREFVKQTLLHGAEPGLHPRPLTHRPHVWLRGRLIPSPAGSSVPREIAPASQFSFVPLAGTTGDPG